MLRNIYSSLMVSAMLITPVPFIPNQADAHCDGMDGPVVKAARKALDIGDANLVLIWVQEKDEAEIKKVFQKTLAVRKLNPQAKELADMYFFETLVRVHRAGEGAPYTGLKPAGGDLGPAIPAADKALESGSAKSLLKLLSDAVREGINEQFKKAVTKKKFRKDDVGAGREFVEAYVSFIHYVERIYEATKAPAAGHYPKSEEISALKEKH